MKSKNRNILVALVAILAFGVVTASSASAALPEFTGSYPNTVTFSGKTEISLYGAETGVEVDCYETAGSGSITGAKTLTTTLTFKDCVETEDKTKCTSTAKKGLKGGEIQTEAMNSTLVYIAKASKEVGIDLDAHETGKPTFLTFVCEHEGIVYTNIVRGAVIAHITPLNTKTKTLPITLTSSIGREQSPTSYENEAGKKISALPEFKWLGLSFWEKGSFEGRTTMTTGLETEVKA